MGLLSNWGEKRIKNSIEEAQYFLGKEGHHQEWFENRTDWRNSRGRWWKQLNTAYGKRKQSPIYKSTYSVKKDWPKSWGEYL